ncbi:MAG: hypothetical protein ACI8W7_003098 [Gammaproteobacteria bacterium]|jgi:hypothetical protein
MALPWMAVDGMPPGVQLKAVAVRGFDLVGVARWANGNDL